MLLVCGGAGYIGSHMVRYLKEQGEEVAVVDNLSTGHQKALADDIPFYEGDIRDTVFLRKVFRAHSFDGVFHFCAHSLVGESMKDPLSYYDNNLTGTISLLTALRDFKVPYVIFSSSAAVYGRPENMPVSEEECLLPENPYGETKVSMEKLFKWSELAYGIKWVALRYFNVAGAWEDGSLGEDHDPETHLIPILLQVAEGKRERASIFGTDYRTPDGTCIRDYIHVMDVVRGHEKALAYLRGGNPSSVINLGAGRGYSVRQVVDQVKKVTGRDFYVEEDRRRPGDPDILVADCRKAKEVLSWEAGESTLDHMIQSAWNFMKKHPGGYDG